jgi:hypothetical protein
MKTVDADGVVGYKLNGENIARSKLRVDSRKWIASRILPKKYGDKLALGGADDLGPVKVETQVPDDVRSVLDAIAGKIAGGSQPG